MSLPELINVWIVLERCPDIPGEWLAHCLDFDVMSQGRSLEHAIEMVGEAVLLVVADDLQSGRNPLERRAPEDDWQALYAMMRNGSGGFVAEMIANQAQLERVAATCELHLRLLQAPANPVGIAWPVAPRELAAG